MSNLRKKLYAAITMLLLGGQTGAAMFLKILNQLAVEEDLPVETLIEAAVRIIETAAK